MLIFSILFLIYIMFSLSLIVDKFLMTNLENLSLLYSLKEYEYILLAIGNCIPEFSTNLMSNLSGNNSIGLGAITGSGAFSISLCFGIALLFNQNVNKKIYYRDSIIFIGILFLLKFFIQADGKINIYQIGTLILLWPIYIMLINLGNDIMGNNTNNDVIIEMTEKNENNKNDFHEDESISLIKNSNDFNFQENSNINLSQIKNIFNFKFNKNFLFSLKVLFNIFYNSIEFIYSYILPVFPNYPIFSLFFSFLSIFIHSNIIIDLITYFSSELKIEQSFLGSTLISWGDNIGDLLNSIILAKNNKIELMISSLIGGQITNMLICLAVPWGINIIKNNILGNKINNITIEKCNFNNLILLTIICMIVINIKGILKSYILIGLYISYLLYEFFNNKIN